MKEIPLLNLLYAGNLSVCIFFVLSGYVLTYRYFKTGDQETLVSGAVRRYPRLLPPVLITILLALVLMNLSLFSNIQAGEVIGSEWLQGFWTFNSSFPDAIGEALWGVWFNGENSYDCVMWTLTTEFTGSLIAFAFVMLFGRQPYRWIAYLIASIYFWDSYTLGFILGVLLADLYHTETPGTHAKPVYAMLLVYGLVLGSWDTITTKNMDLITWIFHLQNNEPLTTVHTIAAFLITLGVLNLPQLKTILSRRVFTYLGRISFSMYLVHMLVLGSVTSTTFLILHNNGVSYTVSVITATLISIPVILAASHLITRYIDQPGITLSKTFYQKLKTDSHTGTRTASLPRE